jgi:hypothetical protein
VDFELFRASSPRRWVTDSTLRRARWDGRRILEIVAYRSRTWTGQRRRPTWFRKCLTTTSAMRGPDFAFDTALVMGHGPVVALRHYAMATAVGAADRHQARLRRLRAETRAEAMRFYGGRRRSGRKPAASREGE